MRIVFLVAAVCAMVATLAAQSRQLNLMPMPAKVQLKAGQLAVDTSFSVGITGHSDARLQRAVERFLDDLRRQTGMPSLDMKIGEAMHARLVVHCEHSSKDLQELGEDESYSLEIGQDA